MKAYKHLVKTALKDGNMISVWDGEEWQVKRSTKYTAIINAIESVEEAQIRIRSKDDNVLGWALIIPFGLEDDETVADASYNEYMNNILDNV
jgi:cytochrome oxidase assembly protein ShyY1